MRKYAALKKKITEVIKKKYDDFWKKEKNPREIKAKKAFFFFQWITGIAQFKNLLERVVEIWSTAG